MTGPPDDERGDRLALADLYHEVVRSIRDHNISRFLHWALLDNVEVWEKFITAPGARGENPGHHSFKGGLAYHSLTAAKLAGQIVDHYKSLGMPINRDIVVAGVILHDIGKAWCYKWEEESWRKDKTLGEYIEKAGYVHTRISKLYHHIPIGYNKFMEWAGQFNKLLGPHSLTEKKINHIGHIILSHHGRRAWSSPVVPNTIEAYIVHIVESMDAWTDKYNKGVDVRDIYDH